MRIALLGLAALFSATGTAPALAQAGEEAAMPEITAGTIHIELSPRSASCKPRDRWLVEQEKQASCCGAVNEKPCCSN